MSATTTHDRRAALATQATPTFNGIDFVEVRDAAQTVLRVHFQVGDPDQADLSAVVTTAKITGGATIPEVPARIAAWGTTNGKPWVEVRVDAPGDFSTYTLALGGRAGRVAILDPYFDRVAFSFKATCPSDVDCETPEAPCPAPAADAVPIDYLAKDFASFKKALSDFSAVRFPAWQERSEADFGVMFMEALASLADDLSYQQDRVAAEAWLETATQRRSLVRLARLVDYEPRVATAARTWLQLTIADSWSGDIPTGVVASAIAPDGAPVDFEIGHALDGPASYFATDRWNRIQAHWWDATEACLPRGSTSMWIVDPGVALAPGRRILIETARLGGERPSRQVVQLHDVARPVPDPLFGVQAVRITWRSEDELVEERDLAHTTIAANLVPATHGRRYTDRFVTTRAWTAGSFVPPAAVRTGANGTRQYLHTLRAAPLAWLASETPGEGPRPELRVSEVSAAGRWWPWRRTLLDPRPPKQVVTVDPMRYRRLDGGLGVADYDGSDGDTLRFGDGVFGAIPADGAEFEVTYRVGGGARGNVAADAITRLDGRSGLGAIVVSVTNPLPAAGGRDEEPDDRVREMAPQHFRATQYRAVRAEDYEHTARELPWVQRAGTTFRYTGSWLSVFTAVDPRAADPATAQPERPYHLSLGSALRPDRAIELVRLLDRRRLAGYEAFVLPPRYAALDVEVRVCARPDAFRGDVKAGIVDALQAFFHPDRFSFGVALERSALEATVQDVVGVDGVVTVRYRRRGHTPGFVTMPDVVEVARDEIVRVDNDPSRPDHGSLSVLVEGGK
jgi:hypothetical protein